MPQKALGSIVGLLCAGLYLVQGKEYCFGVNNEQYQCEMGYCCGETECCTHYYELWLFWLVWTLIIMLSCCCAYRHRRVKMRLQQEQRQREISLMAYQGASSSFFSPPPLNLRFWNDCKLPDYEEVVGHPPTPPPPYSENPPEAAPDPPPQASQPELAAAPQPSQDEQPGSAADALCSNQEAASVPFLPQENAADASLKEEEEEEEEDELVTRRRHVTGDSGIEVCVCRVDVDEGSGLEEENEEEQRMCRVSGGECCSQHQQQPFRQKASDMSDGPATTSTADSLV
ncbi:WW domain-binding protein 1 [Nerophis lumbriciformis]|uniref:WW domain-binding protein 1 n=1 Tax=Nerophis lumbriciformis TaxID=546530 RepID=UPI002ADF4A2B|nr:WW domain-binding protein 1-like [Nerophis lumbriciformis]